MNPDDYHRAYDEEAAKVSMPIEPGHRLVLLPIFLLAVVIGMLIGRLF